MDRNEEIISGKIRNLFWNLIGAFLKNHSAKTKDIYQKIRQDDWKYNKNISRVVDLEPDSLYGSLAALFMYQVLGYMLYQGFLFALQQDKIFIIVFVGVFFVVGAFFQSFILYKVRDYIHRNAFQVYVPKFWQVDEWIKIILGIVFFTMFMFSLAGNFPYSREGGILYALIHFAIYWFISWVVTMPGIRATESGDAPFALIFMVCILFIFIGIFGGEEVFYLFALPGAMALCVLMSEFLVNRQLKKMP